jgi:peptide/nickel transport system permease protein
MGLSDYSIIRRDILPNVMPYVLVSFVGAARNIIFGSVGLYFLGILPFSTLNWGVMLNRAYDQGALFSISELYRLAFPMGAIVWLSFGLILLAQSLDKIFNPRLRAEHE